MEEEGWKNKWRHRMPSDISIELVWTLKLLVQF